MAGAFFVLKISLLPSGRGEGSFLELRREKKLLRAQMLRLRKELDQETVRRSDEAGRRLAEHIIDTYRGGTVTAYWSVANEFSTRGLLTLLHQEGIPLALPVILADDTMEFYRFLPRTMLQAGRFGIPTPPLLPENLVRTEEISCMVVPGVAFDLNGNRLGMGKGYYDRYLRRLSFQVPTIGAAYEFHVVPMIPVGAEDRPVRFLWTECRDNIELCRDKA